MPRLFEKGAHGKTIAIFCPMGLMTTAASSRTPIGLTIFQPPVEISALKVGRRATSRPESSFLLGQR
jgi:hypothetical protein